MLQLVFSMFAIALLAIAATAAVSFINPVAVLAGQESQRLESGFTALRTGYQAYVSVNHAQPVSIGDITPAYAFIPPAADGTAWSFGTTPSGTHYFCLSGDFNPAQEQALTMLRHDFSPQAYFLSAACGQAPGNGATTAAFLLVRPAPDP